MNPYLHANWRSVLCVMTMAALACVLLVTPAALAGPQAAAKNSEATKPQAADESKSDEEKEGARAMQVFYLEIVTKDVDAVCAAYAAALGVEFGKPDAGLGNARTARMPGGGMVGVRAPMRETEEPIVRPYWLVDDIKASLAAAEKSGGQVAHPPLEIPGHGTFAIYIQGGINHGLWQR